MKTAILIIAGLLLAGTAQADHLGNFFNGNQLYDLSQTGGRSFVVGYVTAVHDTRRPLYRFCLPHGVLNGQATDVAIAYLAANPAVRHLDADILVVSALRQAWPCAQAAPQSSPSLAPPSNVQRF